MRVLFICSSLEPGRDGVGDYTRLLCDSFCSLGTESACVALNERKRSSSEPTSESQPVEDREVPVWRFSSEMPWAERGRRLQQILDQFRPDWISFQYVPYGYQDKGLPLKLPSWLVRLQGDFRWHIIFHETWIGFSKMHSWKHRIIGSLQRRIVRNLAKKLSPPMHTSNALYQLMLRDHGVEAEILPMFSGLSVSEDQPQEIPLLKSLGIDGFNRSEWLLLGVFGTIYPKVSFISTVESAIRQHGNNRKIALLGIGRGGAVADSAFDEVRIHFGDQVHVRHFGEQPTKTISEFLKALDFGLATTSREFLGRSTVHAAMRQHGLPVLVMRSENIPEYSERWAAVGEEKLLATSGYLDRQAIAALLIDKLSGYAN